MTKVLILSTSHGASHRRASNALRKAMLELRRELEVRVVDGLEHCAAWFRLYYDSYEIPLRLWPGLWGWIESFQHLQSSTGPHWLYRRGAKPLFAFIREFEPQIVVAAEVGMCELAALAKRERGLRFFLAGIELMDFNQAWVQPEVDLYIATHPDLGLELEAAGAPREKVLSCGMPIDPSFAALPSREAARIKLQLDSNLPLLLVLFGGTGFGKPHVIVQELKKVRAPFQTVFVAGKSPRLEKEACRLCRDLPNSRVLGWVDNMHEWMVAADLLLSKPGGGTLMEAAACGLPMLADDPLPGNEQRTCQWIEKWQTGIWLKTPTQIAPTLEKLLASQTELDLLKQKVRTIAHPRAAYDAAQAILEGAARRSSAT
ncbi:MAG: MGDG synthase family glycosyltransferase [Terriglobia bacterium]